MFSATLPEIAAYKRETEGAAAEIFDIQTLQILRIPQIPQIIQIIQIIQIMQIMQIMQPLQIIHKGEDHMTNQATKSEGGRRISRVTVLQLAAVGVVLLLAILALVIPRAESTPRGSGVKHRLSGAADGPLALVDARHPATAPRRAEMLPLLPLAEESFALFDESCAAMPEAALSLSLMLRDYARAGASYHMPIVTSAYLPGLSASDPAAGGYRLRLALLVPSGDTMREVSMTSSLAASTSAWLTAHAAYYGFLYDGQGGLAYLGTPHAAYLSREGISLADYLAQLETKTSKTPLTYTVDGATYSVFYVKAGKDGTASLTMSEDAVFTVSGTNCGGFVVTVREK